MKSEQEDKMQLMQVLSEIMLLNRDNGLKFTVDSRLERINTLLWNSRYRRLNAQGLFHLFGAKPLNEIEDPIILVSTHIDCIFDISKCFTRCEDDGLMRGTYDNAITNAAILWLMLQGELPDNVLVAFTGDEEDDSQGAKQVCRYFQSKRRKIACAVVLDATNDGWKQQADFTIENLFWNNDSAFGETVIEMAEQTGKRWFFVPESVSKIPSNLSAEKLINHQAGFDESWEYGEDKIECFSMCLPVSGNMHSNSGVLARQEGFAKYTESLAFVLRSFAKTDNSEA